METIKIVAAPASVRDEIKRLTAETHREHQLRQPFAFSQNYLDAIEYQEIDAAFLSLKGKQLTVSPIIFAAFSGDSFVGYIRLSSFAREDLPAQPNVNISDVYVLPEHRGKGIARALLEHVQKLSVERDWDNLTAHVWSGNIASERLFQQAHFVPECKVYRFGPERQARDWVVEKPRKQSFGTQTVWVVLLLLLMFAIATINGMLR